MTDTDTLSYTGTLLLCMPIIALRTSEQRTGLNSNSSCDHDKIRLERKSPMCCVDQKFQLVSLMHGRLSRLRIKRSDCTLLLNSTCLWSTEDI